MLSDEPLKDIYDTYFLSFLIYSDIFHVTDSPGTDYDLCRVVRWALSNERRESDTNRFVYQIGVSGRV